MKEALADMNDREKVLDYIVLELSKISDLFALIDKASNSADGRDNSKAGEDVVRNKIVSLDYSNFTIPGYGIKSAPERHWFDIGNGEFPINIKITGAGGSDNTGSKDGVYFALTGYSPETLKNNWWDTYFNALYDGTKQPANDVNDKDYYFVVLNKETQEIFWTSLRQLNKLGTPNGSNLPFQVPWADNKSRQTRSLADATKFLMSSFAEALEKSSKPLSEYKKHSWVW